MQPDIDEVRVTSRAEARPAKSYMQKAAPCSLRSRLAASFSQLGVAELQGEAVTPGQRP